MTNLAVEVRVEQLEDDGDANANGIENVDGHVHFGGERAQHLQSDEDGHGQAEQSHDGEGQEKGENEEGHSQAEVRRSVVGATIDRRRRFGSLTVRLLLIVGSLIIFVVHQFFSNFSALVVVIAVVGVGQKEALDVEQPGEELTPNSNQSLDEVRCHVVVVQIVHGLVVVVDQEYLRLEHVEQNEQIEHGQRRPESQKKKNFTKTEP